MIPALTFLSGLNWIDGRPLQIEPYRQDLFRRALDERRADGAPRYNMVLSGRAKKNFKTSDMVLAALFCLMCRESPQGSDVLIVANDEDQAGDDLDLAKKLVRANGLDGSNGELDLLDARDPPQGWQGDHADYPGAKCKLGSTAKPLFSSVTTKFMANVIGR